MDEGMAGGRMAILSVTPVAESIIDWMAWVDIFKDKLSYGG